MSYKRAPRALLSRIQQTFAGFKQFDQDFTFVLRWAESFDDLFTDRADGRCTGTDELIPRAFASGRVLLSSGGAGGKTVILQRAARAAVKEGVAALYVDLRRWTSTHYMEWEKLGVGYVRQADFLLQEFSSFRISSREVDELPAGTRKLILVDGLNEVLPGTAEGIISCFDSLVGNLVGGAVVVADRMVRRLFLNTEVVGRIETGG